jgi:hypothetical protein
VVTAVLVWAESEVRWELGSKGARICLMAGVTVEDEGVKGRAVGAGELKARLGAWRGTCRCHTFGPESVGHTTRPTSSLHHTDLCFRPLPRALGAVPVLTFSSHCHDSRFTTRPLPWPMHICICAPGCEFPGVPCEPLQTRASSRSI